MIHLIADARSPSFALIFTLHTASAGEKLEKLNYRSWRQGRLRVAGEQARQRFYSTLKIVIVTDRVSDR